MNYYKVTSNDYILAVGTGNVGEKITESKYNEIISVICSAPHKDGYGYRLKTDLTWEEYAVPPVEPEPLTEEEALTRYANTLTGASDPDLISAAETLIEQRIKEEH